MNRLPAAPDPPSGPRRLSHGQPQLPLPHSRGLAATENRSPRNVSVQTPARYPAALHKRGCAYPEITPTTPGPQYFPAGARS